MKKITGLILIMTMALTVISFAQEWSPETTGVAFMMDQNDDAVDISICETDEDGFMIVDGRDYLSEKVFDGFDYYGNPCFRIIGRRLSPDLVYIETSTVQDYDGIHLVSSYKIYKIENDGFKLQMGVEGNERLNTAVYTDLSKDISEESRDYDISAESLNELFKDYELKFESGENLRYPGGDCMIDCPVSVEGGEVFFDETNDYKYFPTVAHLWYESTHRD